MTLYELLNRQESEAPKTPKSPDISLGYLVNPEDKPLLQKTAYILVAKYREFKLELNWKPLCHLLVFMVLKGALQGAETQGHQ